MKYLPFVLALLIFPALAFAQDTGFVPLTNTPFLEQTGNAVDLPNFLNQIYRLCIGIAAAVAVLQIMRAGILYMGGDSVTEKKEAKNLIAMSIGGLILVLSPVIVFSLINPDILSLKIGGLEDLKTADVGVSSTTRESTLWVDSSSGRADAKSRCEAQGGAATFVCSIPNGASRVVPITESCATGEEGHTVCRATSSTPTGGSCPSTSDTEFAVSASGICNGANGYTRVTDQACAASRCAGMAAGASCCAKPKAARYGWRVHAQEGPNGSATAHQKSGFTSEQQCNTSLNDYLTEKGLLMSDNQPSQCFCNKPLSEQPTCSTL